MHGRRGFTLVELAFVIATIALLTALTIPGYHLLWQRAQTSEARATLMAIAHAESAWRRDHGAFLECLPASGEEVPKVARPQPVRACWRSLGLETSERSHYRYQVKVTPTGFEALAEGDLDGDGVTSRFSVLSNDLAVTTENELE